MCYTLQARTHRAITELLTYHTDNEILSIRPNFAIIWYLNESIRLISVNIQWAVNKIFYEDVWR